MGQFVKKFADGSYLEYGRGRFDDMCVYLTESNGVRRAPRDADYFARLAQFAARYGADTIYEDYVRVYDQTSASVEEATLQAISHIASAYGADALEIEKTLACIYLAMIAEDCKKHTKLGKRIKRIGVHRLLVENWSVSDSANFMRDMGWRAIDALCRERGF